MNVIHVTVKCFSHVKNVLARDELALELPAGATAARVKEEVLTLAGGRLDGLPLRIAVNESFVAESAELTDGDEVVLIPPVQGG